MVAKRSEADTLWRFAGYLAGEASLDDAAKWCGAAGEGESLFARLCRLLGWQAR